MGEVVSPGYNPASIYSETFHPSQSDLKIKEDPLNN